MLIRKVFALTILLCSFFITATQAQKLKNFLDNTDTPFTWLGVDFTQARLLGDAAASPADITRHFAGINDVIRNEPKKYDVPGAFKRSKVDFDVSETNERNASVNTDKIKSEDAADYNRLKPEDITKLVKGYKFGDRKGIGVLFVMEAMSKTEKEAAMYVTVVDMGSRSVLMTERMTGKAQGFGFRNYWAYTVHKVLEHIDYKKWKEKYANAQDPVEETPVAPKKETKTAVAKEEKAKKAPKKKG
ncbi:hypothetical protein [Chitinophaga qingshengii]|uniref:DUF3313 domain-containing protein n=1 Tax=Chitinophaga qingshengii TaxID=1569794 RepID=A0ABR7TQ19_9BACT|nr:hypothetical protein [Chitinophaga qingshengii]MBC9932569.1 hypothetical protein [Chitinophaga qingshengii]